MLVVNFLSLVGWVDRPLLIVAAVLTWLHWLVSSRLYIPHAAVAELSGQHSVLLVNFLSLVGWVDRPSLLNVAAMPTALYGLVSSRL